MSKYIIRLTESELAKKVKDAVNEILNDFSFTSNLGEKDTKSLASYMNHP